MSTSAPPALVFPTLEDEKDFIVSSFVQDGPVDVVDEFDLPFGGIPRGERIGRIADWTGISAEAAHQRGGARRQAAITNTQAKAEEEQEGWSLSFGHAAPLANVSRRPAAAKPVRGAAVVTSVAARPATGKDARTGYGRKGGSYWSNRAPAIIREPSIKVAPTWKLVEEIEFSRLAKVQINVEEPTVLTTCGSAKVYDKSFDKLRAKAEKPFSGEPSELRTHKSASTDDFFLDLANKGEATIFTTDVVASLLMACQRTVLPWDILIRRRGQAVFLDARPGSKIEQAVVHETHSDFQGEVSESINAYASLSEESSKINEALPEFLGKESVKFDEKTGPACRYTKIHLGDQHILAVRSEVSNAAGGAAAVAICKAFLEYQPSTQMDWRQKLDSSRGAVLAHEVKNNGAMVARWIYQAIYSAAASLKLAYVSRAAWKNPQKHVILGVQEFDPYDLATQINLNVANGFGIVRAIAEMCLALPEDQEYALVRDANKPMLRLYSLPKSN